MGTDEDKRRLREILVESKLYFGRFAAMNDPFEGRLLPDFRASAEVVRKYWDDNPHAHAGVSEEFRKRRLEELVAEATGAGPHPIHDSRVSAFMNDLGVCCFVGTAEDIPMWAYYGDSLRGVCLRFPFDHRFLAYTSGEAPPIPVKYVEEYPRPKFYDATTTDLMTTLITTKAKAWSHEKEWRIVSQRGPGSRAFPAKLLDAVILGERMGATERTLVREWVRERKVPTEVLQARSSAARFAIEIVPVEGM